MKGSNNYYFFGGGHSSSSCYAKYDLTEIKLPSVICLQENSLSNFNTLLGQVNSCYYNIYGDK